MVGVVVFDGDCGFCTWSAERLRRASQGRLAIVPWQRADLVLLGLTPSQCASAVQFVSAGRRWHGGAAVAHALIECGFPLHSVGRLLATPRAAPIVERAYKIVAANRHRLPGSTPACAV